MLAERTPITASFQTPPRILIPKLVRSRDAWKAKATQRKQQGKALRIRVRDLVASRLRHRQRADRLAQERDQLRLQLQHTQQQLEQFRQREALQARADGPAAPAVVRDETTPKKTTRS
jgi:hypothetical protein